MKHLIIYAHLNPQSFTRAVVDEVERVLQASGNETKIIDLYAEEFNPVMGMPDVQYSFMDGEAPADVREYQEQITWADHLIFVYPLWWEQMPAMLKGFVDRVFTNGYAFTYDENGARGLLSAKSVTTFINTGNTSEALRESGMHAAIETALRDGVFEFCGMKADIHFFGNIATGSDEERKQHLSSVEGILTGN